MKLENLTLVELKERCKKKKIKGYSKLNKESIILLLKKFKGGSIDNPIISVYIYNVALGFDKQPSNFDPNNPININIIKGTAKQKFNNIYPAPSNSSGIIYPQYYEIPQKFTRNIKKRVFNSTKVVDDIYRRIYSHDPITSMPFQNGGDIENIRNYYNLYKTKLTKELTFVNNEDFYTIDRCDKILTLLQYCGNSLNDYISHNGIFPIPSIDDALDGAYIFKVNVNPNEKVIIFGDFHGSFHAFFRLFTRLHILGVIDFPNFRINDGYKIIFLGDILDRGQYALEIIYIIAQFMITNNSYDNLKIIFNRGNHEDPNLWGRHRFQQEYYSKFNNNTQRNNFVGNFKYFLSNCPSTIILNHNNKKYWLCHGGFPTDDSASNYTFRIPDDPTILFYGKNDFTSATGRYDEPNIATKIRWSDFTNIDRSNTITGTGRPNIGLDDLYKFLDVNKINFVIRGHSDNNENAYLLKDGQTSYCTKYGGVNNILPLNVRDIHEKNIGKCVNNIDQKLYFPIDDNIIKNPLIPKIFQTNNLNCPIAKISTNGWTRGSVSINNLIDAPEICHPVLTISTNSDVDRRLWNESFIILNCSDQPDFDLTNINRKKKEILHILTPLFGPPPPPPPRPPPPSRPRMQPMSTFVDPKLIQSPPPPPPPPTKPPKPPIVSKNNPNESKKIPPIVSKNNQNEGNQFQTELKYHRNIILKKTSIGQRVYIAEKITNNKIRTKLRKEFQSGSENI